MSTNFNAINMNTAKYGLLNTHHKISSNECDAEIQPIFLKQLKLMFFRECVRSQSDQNQYRLKWLMFIERCQSKKR